MPELAGYLLLSRVTIATRVHEPVKAKLSQVGLNPDHISSFLVSNTMLGQFCFAKIGSAGTEGSKSDIPVHATTSQASCLCDNFSDTSKICCLKYSLLSLSHRNDRVCLVKDYYSCYRRKQEIISFHLVAIQGMLTHPLALPEPKWTPLTWQTLWVSHPLNDFFPRQPAFYILPCINTQLASGTKRLLSFWEVLCSSFILKDEIWSL